jgi:adenylate cyclase
MIPADARIAEGFLEDALKLDPNYAAAHALIAWCYEICYVRGGREEADKIAGVRHARAAIASGTDDATALAVAAFALGILSKDYKTAMSVIERALSLNPSSAAAHYWGAQIHASSGNFAAVTAHANQALQLSPFDPVAFVAHIALGHVAVVQGHYDEAASDRIGAGSEDNGNRFGRCLRSKCRWEVRGINRSHSTAHQFGRKRR